MKILTTATPLQPGRYRAVQSCAVVSARLLMAVAGLDMGFLLSPLRSVTFGENEIEIAP